MSRPSSVLNVGKRLTCDTTSWKDLAPRPVSLGQSWLGGLRYGQTFDASYGSHLMSSWSIIDSRHWRDRAEEARLLAADMKDPDSRETMLRIANDYERLAERAQRVAKAIPQS